MKLFSFVTAEDVVGLVEGGLSPSREELLDNWLPIVSSKLSARFPGLKARFLNEGPGDTLYDLVVAMMLQAGQRYIKNPEGMASESIGVFSYTRLDNTDSTRQPFDKEDLEALASLMEEGESPFHSIDIGSRSATVWRPQMFPGHAPSSRRRW